MAAGKKDLVADLQQQIREKEEQFQSIESLVADFQKNLQLRDPELGQQATTLLSAIQSIANTTSSKQIHKRLTAVCYSKTRAPYGMERGSVTADYQSSYHYFAPKDSYSVYRYGWDSEQWYQLPSCPYRDSALVIIGGDLTTAGGYKTDYTNKLCTLQQGQWVEKYPPMKIARSDPTLVSTPGGDYIIVIGGSVGGAVELFQVKTRQWYKLTDLPEPIYHPSATICDNQLHVIGWDKGYTCSLQTLLSSEELITSQSVPHLISWTVLPLLPVKGSTAATLNEQLVIIGGKQDRLIVNSIHQLVNEQWVKIGSMSSDRQRCLVVSSKPDRMMIVGGWGAENNVEECVVVPLQ